MINNRLKTYTIINQIPTSATNSEKVAFKIHKLQNCFKRNSVQSASSNTLVYNNNSFTTFCYDWQHYKEPTFLDGGYYAIEDKSNYFTVNTNDFIVFADIEDAEPTGIAEFEALKQKHKDIGGVITGKEVFINFDENDEPLQTNHIEIIKG